MEILRKNRKIEELNGEIEKMKIEENLWKGLENVFKMEKENVGKIRKEMKNEINRGKVENENLKCVINILKIQMEVAKKESEVEKKSEKG